MIALFGSGGVVYWLVWSEREANGFMNWDRTTGIGLLGVFAVPPGMLLGGIVGMISRLWVGNKKPTSERSG